MLRSIAGFFSVDGARRERNAGKFEVTKLRVLKMMANERKAVEMNAYFRKWGRFVGSRPGMRKLERVDVERERWNIGGRR